jgi:hypothetical protein
MGHSSRRKKAAVRMLGRVMKLIIPPPGISSVVAGSDLWSLDRRLEKLKRLAEDDPDCVFWDVLQKTIIKILERWHQGMH